jgi:hypothetical protein
MTRCSQGNREDEIGPAIFAYIIIHPGETHDLGLEPRESQKGHEGKGFHAALNLHLDLILEKARVAHHFVVEYEFEGEAGEDEIEQVDADEGEDDEGEDLAGDVVPWPGGDMRGGWDEMGPNIVEEQVIAQVEDEIHETGQRASKFCFSP